MPPTAETTDSQPGAAAPQIEGDLLATRRMLGGGAPGRESAADRRSLAARFQSASAVREVLERASASGLQGVVGYNDARLFDAFGGRPASVLPRLLPIVPNIQGLMRDAVEHGLMGAALLRMRRARVLSLLGLSARSVGRGWAILQRDFPTMLRSFVELELSEFHAFDPPIVFLQPQMTDLALAMRNPRIVRAFAEAVEGLTGATPGYMTHNFAALVERMNAWGVPIGAVVTPWSADGAGMRPTREACERARQNAGALIWIDRAGFTESPDAEAILHGGQFDLDGTLRDDDSLLFAREGGARRGDDR